MLELTLRLVFSLAVVVGLIMLLARFSAKRFKGAAGSLVQVVHRQPLSRTSAVAVVTVGSKVLVLGTTEQQVTVLTELDPEELVTEEEIEQALASDSADGTGTTDPADPTRELRPLQPQGAGALAGSVFSARTWKQALAAVTPHKDPS